jgi:hypothetical protein
MPQEKTESQQDSSISVVQEVQPPSIPAHAHVMTVVINHPPGSPGYPPHRVGGPAFGYMISGEMLWEIEGQAPRVLRAGDAFWSPGGDLIHYRDANNRDDIPCSFVLTMLRTPALPMIEPVAGTELEERKHLRINGTGAAPASTDSEELRAHRWREATRELVLTGATAIATAERAPSGGAISITLTGKALSNDVLLAETGVIALSENTGALKQPMSVVPMRLDMLSELPAIRVSGHGVSEPTRLRLVIVLTAGNPHTDATSVMTCECDSVLLDPQTPFVLMDFELQSPG